jgi:hypothetical protein
MWISLIRYWRSGSFGRSASEEEEQGISVAGLSGHQEQEQSKSKSSETKWEKAYRPGSGSAAGTCDRVVKVSFGRVECREFARTVGDNEVVGPIPLSLDWEVLSVMVASVDQYEDFRAPVRKSRKEDFLYPLLKNGLCWKSAA